MTNLKFNDCVQKCFPISEVICLSVLSLNFRLWSLPGIFCNKNLLLFVTSLLLIILNNRKSLSYLELKDPHRVQRMKLSVIHSL